MCILLQTEFSFRNKNYLFYYYVLLGSYAPNEEANSHIKCDILNMLKYVEHFKVCVT